MGTRTATVTPGKTFVANEKVDNDKLNSLGVPSVALAGQDGNSDTLPDAYWYVADSGAVNALVATLSPAAAALTAGLVIAVKVANTNTGPTTINVNALGAKNIKKIGGSSSLMALAPGDLVAGQVAELRYDGTQFQLLDRGTVSLACPTGTARNLKVQWSSVTAVNVTADELVVQDTDGYPLRLSAVNVSPAITASGANGLDSGVEAVSTWYYVWVIWSPTTPTTAGLISLSASAPSLPAGYTHKALVGVVYNKSGGDFVRFYQAGKRVWTARTNVLGAGTATAANTYQSLSVATAVPPTAVACFGSAGSDDAVDVDAYIALAGDSNGVGEQIILINAPGSAFANLYAGGVFEVPLITASTLYWKSVDNTASRNFIDVTGYLLA